MRHEWRGNLWLIIELIIVTAIICYLLFTTIGQISIICENKGFEDEDVYQLTVKTVNDESPAYVTDGENTETMNVADMLTLMRRLRSHPLVESAAFSANATPYTLSWYGTNLASEKTSDSLRYNGNFRIASPEIVDVLRLKGNDGKTSEDYKKVLRENGLLISQHRYFGSDFDDHAFVGKNFYIGKDSTAVYKVGGILEEIKRMAYESTGRGMILMAVDEGRPDKLQTDFEIILRVKKGEGKHFEESFANDKKSWKLRNVYLSQLTSLKNLKKGVERADDVQIRINIAFVGFLLMIIFLGLLGSFWFRVQQRKSEIAIRKVTGATNPEIFRRLLSEVTILLIVGFLLGAGAYYYFYKKFVAPDIEGYYASWVLWVDFGVTYLIMQLIIILGVWFPAYKAMKIEPALALKEE